MASEQELQRQIEAARLQYQQLIKLMRDLRTSIEHEVQGYHDAPSRWADDDSTPFHVTAEWHTMTLDRALASRIERAAEQPFAGEAAQPEGNEDDCPF